MTDDTATRLDSQGPPAWLDLGAVIPDGLPGRIAAVTAAGEELLPGLFAWLRAAHEVNHAATAAFYEATETLDDDTRDGIIDDVQRHSGLARLEHVLGVMGGAVGEVWGSTVTGAFYEHSLAALGLDRVLDEEATR